jgi:hypothetical protein
MSGYGIPRETIARIMGISAQRLRVEFANELVKGSTLANYAVARSLFEMATRDRVPAAAIYWTKARMGWRDRDPIRRVEATASEARPQQGRSVDIRAAVARLSAEGRSALRVVLNELAVRSRTLEAPRSSMRP